MNIPRLNNTLKILAGMLILAGSEFSAKTLNKYDIIVAGDNSGDFKTITEAISSLPMFNYERVVIFIKNGVYREKIKIDRDNISLIGEDRKLTSIEYPQLRTDWIENKDAIGPAVVNIEGDDVIIKNLTIKNTQTEIGPHAFAVYGTGTRTILSDCNITSLGGDTVSLWDYKTGMYYHSNCYFEGAVDFVCPRGWCYIRDSKFYEHKQTASVWHSAPESENQKFVIVNSYFDGIEGFKLARNHYDAMFIFLDCSFSSNLADVPIYRVTYSNEPERNRAVIFGDRYYFENCSRDGGNYKWMNSNLSGFVDPSKVNAEWTFDHKWNPESAEPVKILSYSLNDSLLKLNCEESVSIKGKPIIETQSGKTMQSIGGDGSSVLVFKADNKVSENDLNGKIKITSCGIIATKAYLNNRFIINEIDLSKITRN